MRRFFFRHILIPAFETGIKRRKTFHYWKELERTQWLSREELEKLQFDALQRLVSSTFTHCPYFRQAWIKQGLSPQNLKTPDDFRRWPIIDREIIRQNRMQMRSQVPGLRLLQKSTGGSSGVPLHFDYDQDSHDRRMAAWHRGYSWAGAGPGTKQLYLWSVNLGNQSRWMKWKNQLYARLYRRRILNTFELCEELIPEYLHCLNRHRPDVIVAYAYSMYIFARSLAERKQKPFSPKAIVGGAEKLHRFQKELIESVFQAPVFETYGCREVMLMGAECNRHEGLHITTENLLLEVVDDNGSPTSPGQEGNVVVTDLYNYGMPFIRYANGDRMVAGWGTCSCGRGLPVLKEIMGRRSDMVHTPDGRHISGVFFPHLIKDYPAVRRFVVVQDRID